jgi:hypothetical protein
MTILINILAFIGAMTILSFVWVAYLIRRDSREQMESHRRNRNHNWSNP